MTLKAFLCWYLLISFSRGPAVIAGPRPPHIYEVSKQWFSTFGSTPWNGGGGAALCEAAAGTGQHNTEIRGQINMHYTGF
jgi:hypothetical protein